MNRLIKWAIALGLIWSIYWYGTGYVLRQGIEGWFQAQAARGWQAEFSDIASSGYPLRHVTTLQAPALADPASGIAWTADWLNLDSPAIWPGRQTLRFANTPQRLSYFDRTLVIEATDMLAALDLRPGLGLALNRLGLSAGPWRVTQQSGAVMGAGSLTLEMVKTDQQNTYRFDINAAGFTPGAGLRRFLQSSAALPASFETLALDMLVRFDRPWDISALEQRRPQPVAIDLQQAELRWGSLRVSGTGQVRIDANGVPYGKIGIRAENWREMLASAKATGAIPRDAIEPAERILRLLSGVGGNPETLDVQLSLRDGLVRLGPFPLGPAPRLILR
jgi:hypothetical protein